MSDPMAIDTQILAPLHKQLTCRTCKQVGHKAHQCPNKAKSNDNNPNTNKSPNQNSNRNQKSSGSNGGNTNNRQQQGFGGTAKHCDFHPNLSNHKTEDCSISKAKKTTQPFSTSFSKYENNGFTKEGYTFKDRLPQYTGLEPYCPVCNRGDHYQSQCPKPEAAYRLLSSMQVCRKCCFRGHTADECKNPQKQCCGTCHKSGHKTTDCRSTIDSSFRATPIDAAKRFRWSPQFLNVGFCGQVEQLQLEQHLHELSQQGLEMHPMELDECKREIAARQVVHFPGQQHPVPHICLNNDLQTASWRPAPRYTTPRATGPSRSVPSFNGTNLSVANMTAEFQHQFAATLRRMEEEALSNHDRSVRNHIERSSRLYHKMCANTYIRAHEAALMERQVLSDNTFLQLKMEMGRGKQFWRDPKAMEALAHGHKPSCRCCGHDGVFLDQHMRTILPNVEVTSVQDWEDWGVFVMFDCQCCNDGFDYVARPDCELQEMQLC